MKKLSINDRFNSHVKQRSDGCHEWTGNLNDDGIGRFWYQGRLRRAPRIAWILKHGHIPEDYAIYHTCNNPQCVNPDHLLALPRSGQNTRINPKGYKLTVAKVAEIKRKLRSRVPVDKLADAYGVSESLIYHIKNGRRWSNVHV